jgi:hypothetical protein
MREVLFHSKEIVLDISPSNGADPTMSERGHLIRRP